MCPSCCCKWSASLCESKKHPAVLVSLGKGNPSFYSKPLSSWASWSPPPVVIFGEEEEQEGGHEKLGRNLCEQWFVDYWWKKINITHKKNLLNFVNRPNSPLSPIKHGDYQVKSTSTWWHSVWTVSMSGNIKINIFKITPAFKMVDIVARSFNSNERTKCQWLSLPGQIRSKNIVMSILAAADLYILSIYSCIIWELQSSHLL